MLYNYLSDICNCDYNTTFCFSVGTYAGAAVGGIVFLIVVAVVVVCICAAKNSQRNRVVTMHGGGATVTNVNSVNTVHHPRMLSCISLKNRSLYIPFF